MGATHARAMNLPTSVTALFDLVSPAPSASVPDGRSKRLLLAVSALLSSVVLAGLWGLAANAGVPAALGNALKVPMLLAVSGVASLPITVLVWKLTAGSRGRATDLVLAYAAAVFGGTMVLALLAPIVALYQHSSAWAGPWIAMASAAAGFGVACALFVRVLRKVGAAAAPLHRGVLLPVALLAVTQLATLAQLASVTTPVFGQRTMFGRGIDGLSAVHEEAQ
jgi:Kef-type K+ transport system membrane component KefB